MTSKEKRMLIAALRQMGEAVDDENDGLYIGLGIKNGIGMAMDLLEEWPIDDEEGA